MQDTRGIIATLLLACLATSRSAAQGPAGNENEACNCEYTEQPPDELRCNPYENSELILECTILFPITQVDKDVVWFRTQLETRENIPETASDSDLDLWHMHRFDNADPNIQIREQSIPTTDMQNTWLRSQLRISNLNDSFVGDYRCRIKTESGDWLIPSDSVNLQPASEYSNFGACSEQFAQSKQERKCASWDVTTETPTPSTLPPANPTTSEVPTASDTTEPSTRTAATTPSPTPSTTTEDLLPTTDQRVRSDVSSTNGTLDNDTDVSTVPAVAEDSPQPLVTELYVSISILVVFGVMVFILIPATLYMCIKRRKRGARTRPDLERVRPVELERRSATMPAVASDYLVPQPFVGLSQEQLRLQASRMHRPYSARHSYETMLGMSHEYEDVMELMNEKSKPKLDLANENSQPIYSNTDEGTLPMKRNEAYRACRTTEDLKGGVRVELVDGSSDIIIPNPLYIQTPTGEGSFSDGSNEYINQSCSSRL